MKPHSTSSSSSCFYHCSSAVGRAAATGRPCTNRGGGPAQRRTIARTFSSSQSTCSAPSARTGWPASFTQPHTPAILFNRQQRRQLYQGLAGKKINRTPFGNKLLLKEVEQKPVHWVSVKYEKDRYANYLKKSQADIGGLFSSEERKDLLQENYPGGTVVGQNKTEAGGLSGASGSNKNVKVNEALRVYRALRPDAPSFYEEDAMYRLQAAMNKAAKEDLEQSSAVSPFSSSTAADVKEVGVVVEEDAVPTTFSGATESQLLQKLAPAEGDGESEKCGKVADHPGPQLHEESTCFLGKTPAPVTETGRLASDTPAGGVASIATTTCGHTTFPYNPLLSGALASTTGGGDTNTSLMATTTASTGALTTAQTSSGSTFPIASSGYLPTINADSYVFALEALMDDLADDLETIYCKIFLGLDDENLHLLQEQLNLERYENCGTDEINATSALQTDEKFRNVMEESDTLLKSLQGKKGGDDGSGDQNGASTTDADTTLESDEGSYDHLDGMEVEGETDAAGFLSTASRHAAQQLNRFRKQELRELNEMKHSPRDRLQKLVQRMANFFQLPKDPTKVAEFVELHWDRCFTHLLGPETVLNFSKKDFTKFLEGHLDRVLQNRRLNGDRLRFQAKNNVLENAFYAFSEDFLYDNSPLPSKLVDERNLVADFPVEEMGERFAEVLRLFAGLGDEVVGTSGATSTSTAIGNQFQDFLFALEKIGLRSWLESTDMMQELEMKFPQGGNDSTSSSGSSQMTAAGTNSTAMMNQAKVLRASNFMLKSVNRGKTNFLQFEACDPYKMLHSIPCMSVEEELEKHGNPNEMVLADADLELCLQKYLIKQRVLDHQDVKDGREREGTVERGEFLPTTSSSSPSSPAATLDQLFAHERENLSKLTSGPLQFDFKEENFRWKVPENVIFDPLKRCYVKQQKGVDPLLKLDSFRQVCVELRRMGAMCRAGRLFYFRAIVLVGNGRGTFGVGVGFGNTSQEARKDAATKALCKLEFIDYDENSGLLPTPVRGKEFGQTVTITPRAIGRGLQCNKRFLPLLYILGLDNAKVTFKGNQWFSRVKAIKRAVSLIYSRKTLANSTGQRYALLTSPGDHWVHWPDRWFDKIRESYLSKYKAAKLVRKQILHFKHRGNTIAHAGELKPGWTKHAWMNPLQKWMRKDLQANRFAYNLRAGPGGGSATMMNQGGGGGGGGLAQQ
ncbi:unnamed protein product [Amoebophrya sp. A120]|nr:unnamed protein product [Amoebophrya sp. A120]|eukprot:GSA120T00022236001.1